MADDPKKRVSLEGRLEAMEPQPQPDEGPQAMCYDMAAEPTTADFVCAKCGGRTQYPRKADLSALRDLASHLPAVPGWELRLDDLEFCRSCSPSAPQPPAVWLVVSRKGKQTRTRGITMDDLLELRAYGRRWLGGLRAVSPRLRELLGLR